MNETGRTFSMDAVRRPTAHAAASITDAAVILFEQLQVAGEQDSSSVH